MTINRAFGHFIDMGIYDSRPLRPNSIELRRSYQLAEQIDGTGYEQLTPQAAVNQYAAAYGTNGISGTQQMHLQQQQQQQMYDGTLYHQSHAIYGQSGQGAMSPEPIYGPGTPSRNKPRPSQRRRRHHRMAAAVERQRRQMQIRPHVVAACRRVGMLCRHHHQCRMQCLRCRL